MSNYYDGSEYRKHWDNREEVKDVRKSLDNNKEKLEKLTKEAKRDRRPAKRTSGSIVVSKHLPWMNKGKYSD